MLNNFAISYDELTSIMENAAYDYRYRKNRENRNWLSNFASYNRSVVEHARIQVALTFKYLLAKAMRDYNYYPCGIPIEDLRVFFADRAPRAASQGYDLNSLYGYRPNVTAVFNQHNQNPQPYEAYADDAHNLFNAQSFNNC